jgi:putative DNA primase/helicase
MNAHLDPRTIVNALGGDVTGPNSCNVPGPGHSRTDRSLSITIDPRAPDGFVVHSFAAGDDPLACKDFIRERLGLPPRERGKGQRRQAPVKAAPSGPDPEKEKLKRIALRTWHESVDPTGTIVERYLREHRGLELSADIAGGVIRYHAGLYFDEQTYLPGMVCLLRDITTDEPCGIHRTFLDRKTGQKIDRRMLGIAKGAAIKLDPVGTSLTIGEGVETVLAARMMGLGPVWALGSSGAVGNFPVLKGLSEITILEENDPTSRRDVETCGRRHFYAHTPVRVITPSVGKDMNDAWRAAQ